MAAVGTCDHWKGRSNYDFLQAVSPSYSVRRCPLAIEEPAETRELVVRYSIYAPRSYFLGLAGFFSAPSFRPYPLDT